MRKAILFIMVSLMAFSLVACGDDEKKVTEKETTVEKETTTENDVTDDTKDDETEESSEDEKEMLSFSSFSVNFNYIECHYSSDFYSKDEGVTNFLYKDKKYIFGMRVDTGLTQEAFTGKLEDVVNYAINSDAIGELEYGINMSFDEEKGLEIISSENVKIADVDSIKYTGKIYSNDGKENFYYCYAMILDDTPTVVFGFVYDETQSDELIKEAMKCTDDLVKTIEVTE